jgi:hypothetical protein
VKRAEALFVGVAAGAATAVNAYAGVRVLECALFAEPNPATLIWADRSPYVWRIAIAMYLGGVGAFGGFAAARRWSATVARGLLVLIALAVTAVMLEGALVP